MSSQPWEAVFSGPTFAAEAVHAALEAAGVPCEVLSDTGSFLPGAEMEDARVMVPAEHVANARQVLDQDFEGNQGASSDPEA